MVKARDRGSNYGMMDAVKGVGASALVGTLWTTVFPIAAFASAGLLMLAGAALLFALRQPAGLTGHRPGRRVVQVPQQVPARLGAGTPRPRSHLPPHALEHLPPLFCQRRKRPAYPASFRGFRPGSRLRPIPCFRENECNHMTACLPSPYRFAPRPLLMFRRMLPI